MSDLTPVFDKLPKYFDGKETIGAMNNARTWEGRVKQAKEEQEKKRLETKEEPSMQEILNGIKGDMGEDSQTPEHNEEKGLER